MYQWKSKINLKTCLFYIELFQAANAINSDSFASIHPAHLTLYFIIRYIWNIFPVRATITL